MTGTQQAGAQAGAQAAEPTEQQGGEQPGEQGALALLGVQPQPKFRVLPTEHNVVLAINLLVCCMPRLHQPIPARFTTIPTLVLYFQSLHMR